MEDYNRLISAKILDGYDDVIDIAPQPIMLGGKRMRNFVLPGYSQNDYPGTLSVGRMDDKISKTLGEEFYNDFGDGFPADTEIKGAARYSLERKVGGAKFDLGKSLKSVGKVLKPVAKEVGKEALKEGIKMAVSSGGAKFDLGKTVKSVGKVLKPVRKAVAPIAKEVGKELLKEGIKESKKALKEYIKSGASSAATEGGVMKKPRGRPRKVLGADPKTFTPEHLMVDGGALIKNAPKEFKSSVYPKGLASYNAQLPIASRGAGRKPSARGAIVKEVMKKHGFTLPEASKFVKEKGLY